MMSNVMDKGSSRMKVEKRDEQRHVYKGSSRMKVETYSFIQSVRYPLSASSKGALKVLK